MWISRNKKTDQSTPQATVEGFKRSLVDGDWPQALTYLSEQSQANMIGSLFMSAAYACEGDKASTAKLRTIMGKHGLSKHEKIDTERADLPAIVKDLMRWSDKHLAKNKRFDLADNAAQTEYSEYRTSGDRAYLIATCKGRRSETRLQLIDGCWYFI